MGFPLGRPEVDGAEPHADVAHVAGAGLGWQAVSAVASVTAMARRSHCEDGRDRPDARRGARKRAGVGRVMRTSEIGTGAAEPQDDGRPVPSGTSRVSEMADWTEADDLR